MIREGSGHKFNLRLCKWPASVFGVPAHVNSDLAHWEIRRNSGAVGIHHGFEAEPAANFGSATNPIVALFHPGFGDVAHIKIGATPKAVGFGLQCFVDQTASDVGAWAIEPGHEQNAVGG